jgi:HK97 family phage major capsid protein
MSRQLVETKRQQRKALITQARGILEAAEREGRAPDVSERENFDKLHAEAATLSEDIKGLEADYLRQKAAEESLEESRGRRTSLLRSRDARDPNGPVVLWHGRDSRGRKKTSRVRPGSAAFRRCQPEYRRAFRSYLAGDGVSAVLQQDVGTSGGYLAPEQFHAELIRELDDILWIRQLARTFMIDAPSMGVPYRSAKISSLTRGAELGSPTADTAYKVGKRTFKPEPMTGQVNLSRDLRRSSAINVEALIREEIQLEVGNFEESEFMIGTGAALQALGLFVPSDDGIPTSRDVASTSPTEMDPDLGRRAKYALKQQYRNSPSVTWIFHRDLVSQLSRHKTADGEYLWQEGLRFGDPDMYLGVPVRESEFAPNTLTTGSYVGLLGDMKYYWIVDGMGMEIQVLVETGAKSNQDEIIYRRKMDAQPVLPEAFVRLKLG